MEERGKENRRGPGAVRAFGMGKTVCRGPLQGVGVL